MKNLTPYRISLLISILVAAACTAIFYFTLKMTGVVIPWFYYAITFFVISLITIITVYSIIEKFIYSKIKLIYRTIYNLKSDDAKLNSKIDLKTDVLSDVKREVVEWVQHSKEEVEVLKKNEVFRREFLGNVSHELKTPLFSVQGYIHTLLDGGLEDENINIVYLEKASRAVDRLCNIVDDLEAISKQEAGELILELRSFDIHELTQEVYESLEMRARERKIFLTFKTDSSNSFLVEADKERIRQVMVNLVVNSIKYGIIGGTTEVGFFDLHDNLLVEVTDNGLGIEAAHLPRLFERFYRVDRSRSREQGGTGLGLSIVKHILEAHNQSISVKSKPGEGTTFWFTLKKA